MRSAAFAVAVVCLGACVPIKECESGLVLSGGACVPLFIPDRCASSPCAGLLNSVCEQNANEARCRCPDSLVEVAGACLPASPCAPNPCTVVPNRDVCTVQFDGVARCDCAPGFALERDDCLPLAAFDCAPTHQGDMAEPDECPTQASVIGPGARWARSLSPPGDNDWFELAVEPRHVYRVNVFSMAQVPLVLEVFESAPLRVVAAERSGSESPEVHFSPSQSKVLVRVRARFENMVVGAYDLRYVDVGLDDFPNDGARAVAVQPTGLFTGNIEYQGDVDVVWLDFRAHQAVRLHPGTGAAHAYVLSRPGASITLMPDQEVSVTFPEDTLVELRVEERGALGPFSVNFAAEGPDDFCDAPIFASVIAPQTSIAGTLGWATDVDTFLVEQVADHFYSVEVQGVPFQVIDRATGVVLTSSVASSPTWGSRGGQAMVRMGPSTPTPYRFVVRDRGPDDHPDVVATGATPLAPGTAALGTIQSPSDTDVFELPVVQGHAYVLNVSSPPNTAPPFISLRDSFARPAQLFNTSMGSEFTASRTGSHWAVLTAPQFGLSEYAVRLDDLGPDDHGDDAVTATPLVDQIEGRLTASDVDAFSFSGIAGETITVRFVIGAGFPNLQLRSPSDMVQPFTSSLTTELTETGTWLILASGQNLSDGQYTVTLERRPPDDFGDDQATAHPVIAGQTVPGRIDGPQDVDVFALAVQAGHGYFVRPPQGAQVSVRLGSFFSPTPFFEAGGNGTAFISVSGSQGLAYSLVIDDLGLDDHGDGVSTSTDAGTSLVSGAIQSADDTDVFGFDTLEGHYYRAVVSAGAQATVLNALGIAVPALEVRGGTRVWVEVRSPTAPVAYTLRLDDLGADDHGDTTSTGTTVLPDAGWVSGTLLSATDRDLFLVPTTGIVQIEAERSPGLGTVNLQAQAPGGVAIAMSLGAGGALRTGVRATTGDVVIGVSGTNSASYQFRLFAAVDDFPDQTDTPLTPGTPQAGIIDCNDDTDTFTFVATAGQSVNIALSSARSLRQTVLNPAFNQINGGSFVAPLTGTYRVSINSYEPFVMPYTLAVQVQ